MRDREVHLKRRWVAKTVGMCLNRQRSACSNQFILVGCKYQPVAYRETGMRDRVYVLTQYGSRALGVPKTLIRSRGRFESYYCYKAD